MTDTNLNRPAEEMAIRTVLDEYCLRLEVNRFDEWLDLFTEDTVYEVYGMRLGNRAEMADLLKKAPHGVHLPGAARITIDGDRAETLQSYLFIGTSSDEWNAGWYQRELLRTEAGWKISRTRVKFGRKESLPANERASKLPYPISF